MDCEGIVMETIRLVYPVEGGLSLIHICAAAYAASWCIARKIYCKKEL